MIHMMTFSFQNNFSSSYVGIINPKPLSILHFMLFYSFQYVCIKFSMLFLSTQALTMGCVKSKEDKGPAKKYQSENSPASDANPTGTAAHIGHYGPDPTQLQQNQVPSSLAGPGAVNLEQTFTPFGGSSAAMTPFGGTSSSFSGPMSSSFSGAVSSEY